MNETRARFEEIWPVPKGVCWCVVDGGYFAESTEHIPNSMRHNARLDTFARSQETTDVYVSLIDEMLMEIKGLAIAAYGCVPHQSQDILDRTEQIMGDKK